MDLMSSFARGKDKALGEVTHLRESRGPAPTSECLSHTVKHPLPVPLSNLIDFSANRYLSRKPFSFTKTPFKMLSLAGVTG